MFDSIIKQVGTIELPAFTGAQIYMQKHVIGDAVRLENAPDFEPVVERMLLGVELPMGSEVFITVDRKSIKAGATHRRGGAHVDGNYIFDWGGSDQDGGGGGWLTGVNGRVLSPENHQLQYCNPNGGMLIASDHQACRAWEGTFHGQPNQGGDCTHLTQDLEQNESFLLEPNRVYLSNSTCVHESLPLEVDVDRTLVRITLPPVAILN